MRTRLPALAELACALRATDVHDWHNVTERFTLWAARADLCAEIRAHLETLSDTMAETVRAKSRETTTHYAWCLMDQQADAFSFWLHEYKPQLDWRIGYADSVHNHRYHFCTTLLKGSYLHERFTTELNANGTRVLSATLQRSGVCAAGESGTMLAHEFHRIPKAEDGTITFLVKSRAMRPWSLSFDPATGISRRHIPVEQRLTALAEHI
ncbi:hypothetical protein [Actinocrispum sp. NPDC049592]|uniref:hypothetical protein n=1 Tax=Actinocrispum sp. NPDC049592 TaxID=3154835 RepID=UPI003416807F